LNDHSACAAALLAVDPRGLGGASLRARPGVERDAWIDTLVRLMPGRVACRRIPSNVGDGRLLGGLDLAATLRAGRLVEERGLLAECDGGVAILAMAERASPGMAASLACAMDSGRVAVARDGLERSHHARFLLVALDEGAEPDEQPPAVLLDRVAFHLAPGLEDAPWRADDIAEARRRLPRVSADDAALQALAQAAIALGIGSQRAELLALRAARAHAALQGRIAIEPIDLEVAAHLVLGPRATRIPSPSPPPPPNAPDEAEQNGGEQERAEALQETIVEAAQASLPPGLLGMAGPTASSRGGKAGRSGPALRNGIRGRRIGARRGELQRGARVDLVETLRAAAPWQALRRRARTGRRIVILPQDLRLSRHEAKRRSTAIFVVDASGSAALHRLAEAKGAVLLMLADCYVRRDEVALVAFRGSAADLLLPPTRSLVRAKKCLTALPGGGGTPLAAGLDAAFSAALGARRAGASPLVVLLTDGRANVARDGRPDRASAEAEADQAGTLFVRHAVPSVLVDVSPQPRPQACRLAVAMGARYAPLPRAGAADIAGTVAIEMARHADSLRPA